MEQITRGELVRVGVDLAKHVIQVHAVDGGGRVVVAKALARDRFMAWCAQLPPGRVVAMESCGGAHHWARKLAAMGLQPRLVATNQPRCRLSPRAQPGCGAGLMFALR